MGNTAHRVGVELGEGGDVVDFSSLTMRAFLESGAEGTSAAQAALSEAKASGKGVVKRADATLHAPVESCDKVVCIGMNYHDHCTEQNMPVPTEPLLFNKVSGAGVGLTPAFLLISA